MRKIDKKQIELLVQKELDCFLKEQTRRDLDDALSSTDALLSLIDEKLGLMLNALDSMDMSMDYVAAGLLDAPTAADIELTQRRRGRFGRTQSRDARSGGDKE